jgi:hypothetical protein
MRPGTGWFAVDAGRGKQKYGEPQEGDLVISFDRKEGRSSWTSGQSDEI